MKRKSDDIKAGKKTAKPTRGSAASLRAQVGALCYRWRKGEMQVLLVTTDHGRWIIPKGWPEPGIAAHKQAEIEAFEEAGILGEISEEPIATYVGTKHLSDDKLIDVSVSVYPLRALERARTYPEKGQREVRWFTIEKAARRCGDKGLAKLLRSVNFLDELMAA